MSKDNSASTTRVHGLFSDFLDDCRKRGTVVLSPAIPGWVSYSGSITLLKNEKTFSWVECLGNLSMSVCLECMNKPIKRFCPSHQTDKQRVGILYRKLTPLASSLIGFGLLRILAHNFQDPIGPVHRTQALPLALFIVNGCVSTLVAEETEAAPVITQVLEMCRSKNSAQLIDTLIALTREAVGSEIFSKADGMIMQAHYHAVFLAFCETLNKAPTPEQLLVKNFSNDFLTVYEARQMEILSAQKSLHRTT